MEQYKITVFTELSTFNMTLILILCTKFAKNVCAFFYCYIVSQYCLLRFKSRCFFQLSQTFSKALASVKWAIVTCFISDLFSNRLTLSKSNFCFLNATKMYTCFSTVLFIEILAICQCMSILACAIKSQKLFFFSSTLVLALRIILPLQKDSQNCLFYHVDTASPADVFMIAFW